MSEARKYPSWYWPKGLHDAKILEASMRDDALVLRIDSGNAMYDNFVEQIVFLDARLKKAGLLDMGRADGASL